MGNLMDDADKIGKQIHDKREAEKAAKSATEKAAKQELAKQKQRKKDKEQGMI